MKELLFGTVTTYNGNEFYIWRNEKGYLEIYTWDKSKVDKTFTQESGQETLYKKVVHCEEIGDVYDFRKCFEYKGYEVSVTITKQGKYNLCTTNPDVAREYGFVADQFDRDMIRYHKDVEFDDKDLVMVKEERMPKHF